MPPTGAEGIEDDAPVSRWRDAVRALERQVAGNGEDQRRLEEVLKGVEESSDRIKKQIADDRVALERRLGESATDLAARFGEADVKLERVIGDLRAVITSGFAELRGERAAEQRLTNDHRTAARWTWQLVVFAGISLASLALGILNAIRK